MSMLLARRATAEFLGTGLLVATVVGSGIMGTNLSDDTAVVLLVNALATVAALGTLIWMLGPISGAHFNPAVTGVELVRREISFSEAGLYVLAQAVGAMAGVALANIMFGLPAWQASTTERTGWPIWLGEVVATGGLLLVIGALTRTGRGHLGPAMVPAWIGAAYFFTSSTSFANPAVTLGRSMTDTFAGIDPSDVAMFVLFQVVGAAIGALLTEFFYPRPGAAEPLDLPDAVHLGASAPRTPTETPAQETRDP